MKVLKFGAPWCGPCKMQDSILDKLEGVEVTKINVDDNTELTEQYHIQNVPVTIILDDNNNEVERFVGLVQLQKLKESLGLD